MRQAFSLFLIAASTALTCLPAVAVGLGPVRSSAVLGQPLDLPVPMRLDDGESIGSDCVSAEVTVGEQRLPRSEVRVVVVPGARVDERLLRVISSSVIQEPVVSVAVSAGCPLQLMRRFVVFADPPMVEAAAPAPVLPVAASPAPAPAAPAATAAAADSLAGSSPSTSTTDGGTARAAQAPREPPQARPSSPAPHRAAPVRRVQKPRAAVAKAAAPRRPAALPRPAPATVAATAAVPAAAPASSADTPASRPTAPARASESAQPRLKLEAPDHRAPALASVAPAAVLASAPLPVLDATRPAASSADEAPSSTSLRMQAMEAEMVRLRKEAAANREALLQLRTRLDDEGNGGLLTLLGGAAVLLALLAAWFAWRLHKLSHERQPWWDSRSAVLPPAVEPVPVAESTPAIQPPADRSPAARRAETPETLPQAVPPEMSVDEQIDLEQQADFFLVLGQDEAAVDLLQANLRATGGHSPLPYLKLLDIHRRHREDQAYEQLRQRFNERFNATVPPIDADPAAGRGLEDYPAVASRLQRHWARPLDAMAYLEALLFRRRDEADRFDLPAYRDLLTLYQLARELSQQQEGGQVLAEVDLLLPLDDEEGRALQAVHPSAFERTAVLGPGDVPPRPDSA